jgi:hypothetical protein
MSPIQLTTMKMLRTEWASEYLAQVREDAHQLLAWAYLDARSSLGAAGDECEITGILSEHIDRRLESIRTPHRFRIYVVYNEKPTSPDGQLGKRRPKLDIQIMRTGGRPPRRHFTFEAKRLRDDSKASVSDTIRQYLGEDGLSRFLTGRYVPESVEAAMLGCMQARDAKFWFTQIEIAFLADIANGSADYGCRVSLKPAAISKDLPYECVSEHARANGTAFRMFHVLIDCRATDLRDK